MLLPRGSLMADGLIVSLDEFAELARVTPETMRTHLKNLLRDATVDPEWLVERGDRGRAYKIEAAGGLRWWIAKQDADLLADEEKRGKLQQMRLDIVGEGAEAADHLTMSGRQRRDEYAAAMDAVKYRKMIGELLEKVEVERVISGAAVELRRRLQQIAPEFGILAGLQADQVQQLAGMTERAVEAFVDAIAKPDAFAGDR